MVKEEALACVQSGNLLHVFFRECEVENVNILLHSLDMGRFWNIDNSSLDQPPQCNLTYTHWDNMMRVLQDGRLKLDNNLAENELRPITLGRKNYLFNGNHESVANMCVITSLLATCRNHDINPRLYLNDVIATMPDFEGASSKEIRRLLPHLWKQYHPEAIMTTPFRELVR